MSIDNRPTPKRRDFPANHREVMNELYRLYGLMEAAKQEGKQEEAHNYFLLIHQKMVENNIHGG